MTRQTFYFSAGPYLQAMHGLHSALSGSEAFVKFIGQPRTGKSGVCEKLAQFLRHKDYRVIYFDYAVESPDMLRSLLAKELDIPGSFNMLRQLEDALAIDSDKPLILIFDDAHLLSDITLIEIYRLASVQVQQRRVINLVLCGEPELERRLNRKKEFTPLLQHVSHNFLLEPMDADTSSLFLQAFLEQAGLSDLQLEPAARNQFFKSSRGYPGPAHSLCQLLLSLRQQDPELSSISKEVLQRAIRSADSEQPVSSGQYRDGNRRMLITPIAAVVVIASLAFLLRLLNPAQSEVEEAAAAVLSAAAVDVADDSVSSPFVVDEPSPGAGDDAPASAAIAEPASAASSAQSAPSVASSVEAEAPAGAEEPVNAEELPVSDSSLALVTAQERGIASETLAEPEFEPLTAQPPAAAAVPASPVVVETPVATGAAVQLPGVTLTRPMLALDDEESDEPAPTQAQLERPATSAPTTAADTAVAPASIAQTAEAMVQRWLDAWQGQDLATYFASYDADYVPRYHGNRSQWRANRERVIGNASQISLQLSDFEVVAEDAETVEVHFWLAYRSPTYRDDTRKKLILKKLPATAGQQAGRLVILEEINLEVRV